ncbi:DNA polymerase ligase N-terminal domain-containing protein [Acidicapsa dinghuensis]|uniref:DNA polymerase ligase N-terminal domain-containing protein n=1 Tax=Acidicapsa dinghuensis TaxID=2218256 RepID=A0ABW1EAP0_9BACT|nr:DNA polymerase ligase N-terminal domain-containing protein [Acidicapsa dinghuensis]
MGTQGFTQKMFGNGEEAVRLFNAAVDQTTLSMSPQIIGVNQTTAVVTTQHNRIAALKRHFCVKKHDATRLHYDFRLEWNGVLLSWALPTGPSYCIEDRREAIEMEDHDPANIAFEGVIPEGRYGAGVVMLWEVGYWEPLPEYQDVELWMRYGYLKFRLIGNKLQGIWILRRCPNRYAKGGQPIWYLIKESDSFARTKSEPDILKDMPNGVLSRRTLAEIEHYWFEGEDKDCLLYPRLFEF